MKLVILLETVKLNGELVSPFTKMEMEDSLAESLCASKVVKLVVAGEDDRDLTNLGSASLFSEEPENNSPETLEKVGSEGEEEKDSSGEEAETEEGSELSEVAGTLDAMKDESIAELKEVKGVGAEIAELLYSNGIKNIAELQTKKVADLKKFGIAEKQAQTIFNDAKNFG